ncbi:MAG: HisA/HisF-related TIM barrel protein [Gemmatimonadaceae bacterium]|nr:HisA/HisF-related TIM barrel protein [Gemmatimonadaceae bacterium]
MWSSVRAPSRTRNGWRRWPTSFRSSSSSPLTCASARSSPVAGRGPCTLTSTRRWNGSRRSRLAGVLVTAVHKEGLMQGADLALMEEVAEASDLPVIASGGIATDADLRLLEDRGVSAAVLGMALYTGALDARAIAEEFRG